MWEKGLGLKHVLADFGLKSYEGQCSWGYMLPLGSASRPGGRIQTCRIAEKNYPAKPLSSDKSLRVPFSPAGVYASACQGDLARQISAAPNESGSKS